jgi:hypothetical protein
MSRDVGHFKLESAASMPRDALRTGREWISAVYPLLNIRWRGTRRSERVERSVGAVFMPLESLQSVIVLLIGFAVAGSLATGYQLVTERPLSFRLLNSGPQSTTFLAIPVLTFAAPFVIMRNVMRGRRIEGRRFEFVMLATVIAGLWSLLSGTVVTTAFTACSQLFG